MHSDIHVAVRFHDQSIFAGEDLRCTITFKNVASSREPTAPGAELRRRSRRESISQIAAQVKKNNNAKARLVHGGLPPGNHEPPPDSDAANKGPVSAHDRVPSDQVPRPTHKQQRSVSIISVTSPIAAGDAPEGSPAWAKQQRPGHQRVAGSPIPPATQRQLSQTYRVSPTGSPLPSRGGRGSPRSPATSQSRTTTPDFRTQPDTHVPARPQQVSESAAKADSNRVDATVRAATVADQITSERSSGDFYSLSNHSQETLVSEQPSALSDARPLFTVSAALPRRPASKVPPKVQAVNLLMGYAQLNATFTLDSSLIEQAHFDDVKHKGFLGGQAGGGVVGVKKPRPNSGFLGGFNFNTFGESLNTLIGNDSMSSVKEMSALTNSRAIPLLLTPQSLLFVNMHLEPGDEQSYSYTYPLPKGLPSSHRGKAIKISYNLTVGVQGVPGSRDLHAVRQVNVPVRVFSGVDDDGEIFGHDLMQPHVILQDRARAHPVHSPPDKEKPESPQGERGERSSAEFLQFVDRLLDRHRRRLSSSGTVETFSSGQGTGDASRAIQAINRAILFSNQLSDSDSSPNRYEISRNGLRVAVVIVDRPLHRLGETITAVIDFADVQVSCASLRSTLETSETVSPSLAIRSAATINRVTRKIHASRSENVLFSRRMTFSPNISASATPTFVTSGVNLDWSLRFEFGTIKPVADEDGGGLTDGVDLLEEIVHDDKGSINVAAETLDCDTFDVVIPMTVYGDILPDGKEGEEISGLPI